LKTELMFITQVFYPDRQVTSVLLSQLTAKLAERGARPVVFSGYPALVSGLPSQEVWHGVRILRGGLIIDGKKNLLMRALAYLFYCVWLVWCLLFRVPLRAHLVVVTNPPFAPLIVWICGRFRNWTYDVLLHDIYPDGLIALGRMGAHSLLARIWSGANRRALTQARLVFALVRDMADLCRQRYNLAPAKLRLMPDWRPTLLIQNHSGTDTPRAWWRTLRGQPQ
jgi:hypothetical protein